MCMVSLDSLWAGCPYALWYVAALAILHCINLILRVTVWLSVMSCVGLRRYDLIVEVVHNQIITTQTTHDITDN